MRRQHQSRCRMQTPFTRSKHDSCLIARQRIDCKTRIADRFSRCFEPQRDHGIDAVLFDGRRNLAGSSRQPGRTRPLGGLKPA